MSIKKERKLKVYGMGGYKGVNVPTIMLKGKWLDDFGFNFGTRYRVNCEQGRLVIVRDDGTALDNKK